MPKGHSIPLTPKDKSFIKRNYLKKPIKTIQKELGISYGRIMRFLKNNDLEIPKELIEKRKRDSQFQKNSKPYNKGKKQSEFMSVDGIERSKRTRFVKGHVPHNTKINRYGKIIIEFLIRPK